MSMSSVDAYPSATNTANTAATRMDSNGNGNNNNNNEFDIDLDFDHPHPHAHIQQDGLPDDDYDARRMSAVSSLSTHSASTALSTNSALSAALHTPI